MSLHRQTLSHTIIQYCDRFLYPAMRTDSDLLFRGRLLIGMLLGNQILLIASFIFVAVTPSSPGTLRVTLALVCGLIATFNFLLRHLQRTGALRRCILIAVSIAFITVETAIMSSGGPLRSSAIEMGAMPALLAFCLGGRSFGLCWAGITIVAHIALITAQVSGVNFPNVVGAQIVASDRITAWTISFFSVISIMVIYEIITHHLQLERDRQRANYEYLATHDALTNIANRAKFMDELTLALDRAKRHHHFVGVLYIDVDGFKPINDSLGHEAGDRVLQIIAQRIVSSVRNLDTAARLGGDEFAVILEKINSVDDILAVAEKLRANIAQPLQGIAGFAVTGSIGIAVAPPEGIETSRLIQQADQAMYRAKKTGNAVVLFDAAASNA